MSDRVLRPMDLVPDELDAPFWEGCKQHVFLVHRCIACGRRVLARVDLHRPWLVDDGMAIGIGARRVFTYTVVHHAYDRSLADKLPYAVAVVKLDEGPFFHTDIVSCAPSDVHVGMLVRVVFESLDDDTVIPHFTPDTGD